MVTPDRTRSALVQLQRDERAALLRRRRVAGLSNRGARALPTVGLALSGGGIRSATFGLGLIRGLASQDLLRRIDYLSTVSGGGYVGAMLGRLICAIGLAPAQQTLAAGSSPTLDWLRRNGRYLTPAGSRDIGILIVSYLRAFLAVHVEAMFALVLVALAVTLPHLLQNSLRLLDATAWQDWTTPWFAMALLWAAASLPALLVGYWAAPETSHQGADGRRIYLGDVGLLLVLLALAVLLTLRPGKLPLLEAWQQGALTMPLLVLSLWSAALGHAAAMLYLASSRDARVLAVGRWRNRLTYALRTALLGLLLVVGAGALDWASWEQLLLLSSTEQPGLVWGGVGLGGVALLALRALAPVLQQLASQAQARRTLALGPLLLNIAGHLAMLVLVLAWLLVVQWWVFAEAPLDALRAFPGWMRWLMLALAAALWWLTTSRLPQAANASSLSGFYQARLVRAWLAVGNLRRGLCAPITPRDARLRNVTQVASGDDLELTRHRPESRGGPLHLISTCLNQTRDDHSGLYNADRKGQLLIASARGMEIGTHEVVRWPADEAAGSAGRASASSTLGQWVAISGAAAAPGAGSYTSRGWALVMFLLGIRLGRWVESSLLTLDLPTMKARLWRRAPKPLMLWSEACAVFFGPNRPWWYLSDGGHFDNTGVYALIKRECDFIVLSDAGADRDYEFADIENLVRKARIDLDAEIEFYPRHEAARLLSLPGDALSVLSPNELADNESGRGVLMARIRYRRSDPARGEREGTLLVIKPNLHAGLDLDLLAYAQRHPNFPHESTGDQFFDEAQWESYQRLGEDAGQALYDRWLAQLPGWDRVQMHKLAAPARLSHALAAAGDGTATAGTATAAPRWRRSVRAAAIGTSLGVGVIGTALLSLWQVQDQFKRSADSRGAEIRELLDGASRELHELGSACARIGAHTLGHVEQLRALNGSNAISAAQQTTVTRLLDRLQARCADGGVRGTCDGIERAQQEELCQIAQKERSDSGALSYWHPSPRPPDAIRDLSQVWALLTGEQPRIAVAMAPQERPVAASSGTSGQATTTDRPPPPAPTPVPAPAGTEPAATDATPTPRAPPVAAQAPELVAPVADEQAAAIRAQCPDGTRLYTQIYDESARPRADQLRLRLQQASARQVRAAGTENVSRTAAMRQQRRPVPWLQPTFIVHEPALRTCAQALAEAVQTRWPRPEAQTAWVTDLPAGLKGQPRTIEMWLPTPPADRASAR